MKKVITVTDAKLNVYEPIIMKLINKYKLPVNELENAVVSNNGDIIILMPSEDMYEYMLVWSSFIMNPNTGACVYPEILNIIKDEMYEFMQFRVGNVLSGLKYRCIDSDIENKKYRMYLISKEKIVLKVL